jgi:tetratricopeptide (TPR) repeat protein
VRDDANRGQDQRAGKDDRYERRRCTAPDPEPVKQAQGKDRCRDAPDSKTTALYFFFDYEAAAEAAEAAIRSYPDYPGPYRWLAAALGQAGRAEEAKKALARAIAVAPTSFSSYVRNRLPWLRSEDHDHMLHGLRKAGCEG